MKLKFFKHVTQDLPDFNIKVFMFYHSAVYQLTVCNISPPFCSEVLHGRKTIFPPYHYWSLERGANSWKFSPVTHVVSHHRTDHSSEVQILYTSLHPLSFVRTSFVHSVNEPSFACKATSLSLMCTV